MEQRITKWHFAMDKKFQSRIVWCVVCGKCCVHRKTNLSFIYTLAKCTHNGRSKHQVSEKTEQKQTEKWKWKTAEKRRGKKILIQRDSWNKCAENLNADIFRYIAARVNSTHHHKHEMTDWYDGFARSLLIKSNALNWLM